MRSLLDLYPKTLPVRISWDALAVEKIESKGKEHQMLVIPFYLVDRLSDLISLA